MKSICNNAVAMICICQICARQVVLLVTCYLVPASFSLSVYVEHLTLIGEKTLIWVLNGG